MAASDFKLIKGPLLSRKSVNINVSRSAAPKLALVPASRYNCDVNSLTQCLCKVLLGLLEVQMGTHVFKLNKVPFSAPKSVNINISRSAAPKLTLVPANRYNCDVKQSNLNVCAKFH